MIFSSLFLWNYTKSKIVILVSSWAEPTPDRFAQWQLPHERGRADGIEQGMEHIKKKRRLCSAMMAINASRKSDEKSDDLNLLKKSRNYLWHIL